MSDVERPRLVVGLSGASGAVYGLRVLDACRELGVETHLVVSRAAALTLSQETGLTVAQVAEKADVAHRPADIGAAIASGSFRTLGMVIMPCSIHTASSVAYCQSDNLLTRAADVVLKERRNLVLAVREAPLSDIHLENMLRLSRMGAVVMPPVPAFYTKPQTLDDIVNHTVARLLDQFGIEVPALARWTGEMGTGGED